MQVFLSNLVTNMVIYYTTVYIKGDGGTIGKYRVRDFPITSPAGMENFITLEPLNFWEAYMPPKQWVERTSRRTTFSMQDMGIIPNTYNDHATWTTLTEAKKHFEVCLGVTMIDTTAYDRAMQVLDI